MIHQYIISRSSKILEYILNCRLMFHGQIRLISTHHSYCKANIWFSIQHHIHKTIYCSDEKIGKYCRNINNILDIGGGRNEIGHRLLIGEFFSKKLEILPIFRYKTENSLKNKKWGARVREENFPKKSPIFRDFIVNFFTIYWRFLLKITDFFG